MDAYTKYKVLYKGTKAEHSLEAALCKLGVPYRWQHPVWKYIVDFTLPHHMVAIEVDGSSHTKADQKKKDAERTAYLESKGWRVVRCWNDEAVLDPVGTVNRLMAQAGLIYRLGDDELEAGPADSRD